MPPILVTEHQAISLLAAQPVRLDTGCYYPCSRMDLWKTQHLSCRLHPRLAPVDEAVTEVVRRNRTPVSQFSHESRSALYRLKEALDRVLIDSLWGPDLIIKMFADLDRVFFDGRLLGIVKVSWEYSTDDHLGHTTLKSRNRAEIVLNPHWIGFRTAGEPTPFCQMFGTMLHEMCHAYFDIRCSRRDYLQLHMGQRDPGHGLAFYAILQAVGRNALVNLGVFAIACREDELYYWFMDPPGFNQAMVNTYVAERMMGRMNYFTTHGAHGAYYGPNPQMNGAFLDGIFGYEGGFDFIGGPCPGIDLTEDFDDDDDDEIDDEYYDEFDYFYDGY